MFDLAIMIVRGRICYALTAQLNLSDLNLRFFADSLRELVLLVALDLSPFRTPILKPRSSIRGKEIIKPTYNL